VMRLQRLLPDRCASAACSKGSSSGLFMLLRLAEAEAC
jgi:hypothetical protein